MSSKKLVFGFSIFSIVGMLLILVPEIGKICTNCATKYPKISSKKTIYARKTNELSRLLDSSFDKINNDIFSIPRIYIQNIPTDFSKITDYEKKKIIFVRIILPQILVINENIKKDRLTVIEIFRRKNLGESITESENAWISNLSLIYNCQSEDEKTILMHLDIIPPSLAIAQAAVESGWGTSRFALKGNALFGQHTFNKKISGFYPSKRDESKFKVVRFRRIIDSVWAYTRILNSHSAYKNFREKRLSLRHSGSKIDGEKLARTLTRYSEQGEVYTNLLVQVMRQNGLGYFDEKKLVRQPSEK